MRPEVRGRGARHARAARGRHAPMRGRHAPVRGRHAPVRGRHAPVRGRHAPMRGRYAPMRGRHVPVRGRHVPVRGALPCRAGERNLQPMAPGVPGAASRAPDTESAIHAA